MKTRAPDRELSRGAGGGRHGEAASVDGIARLAPRKRLIDQPSPRWAEPQDIIEISPEAVFRYIATRHNPRRMSEPELHSMADELWWWGAITDIGRQALLYTLYARKGDAGRHDTADDLLDRFRRWRDRCLSRDETVAGRHASQALAVLERIARTRGKLARDGASGPSSLC